MDLKQLRYFTTIAQEGSISAAAQKLFMSQPPLSCQMKALEEELNCTLFERGSRSIHLTDEGKLLYNRAISLLEMSDVTKEELLSFSQKEHGIIRIGIVSSVVSTYGIQWISGFSKQYPDVQFEIYEANTYQLLEKLKTCTIHFAILRTPYTNDSYTVLPLVQEKLIAVGVHTYFRKGSSVSLKQLSKQPLITYRRWERIITQIFEKRQLPYHYICINDDARTTATLTENKIGIGIIPESALALITNPDIISRPISDCQIQSGIELLYNPDCYIPSCGSLFLEYMKSWK